MKENYQSFWVNIDYTNLMKINNPWKTIIWIEFQLKIDEQKKVFEKEEIIIWYFLFLLNNWSIFWNNILK